MSRKIKFRVWDKENECWLNFGYTKFYRKEDGEPDTIFKFDFSVNYIVEQYTGLIDKNDKEIYEGDIITHIDRKYRDGSDRIYKVIWSEEQFSFIALASGEYVWLSAMEGCEVIGNIHENPELLEKVK